MTYPKTIHREKLRSFLNDQSDEELYQSFGIDREDLTGSLTDVMGGPGDTRTGLYSKLGLSWDDDSITLANPCTMIDAAHLCNLVSVCYEGYLAQHEPALASHIWDALGLGGDDSVDECGSAIGGLLDLIQSFLDQ